MRYLAHWPFWMALALATTAGLAVSGVHSASGQSNRWAVVIGIGRYEDPTIPRLQYAVRDARAVYEYLVDQKGGAYPKERMLLLLDEQVTAVAVRSALGTWLARSVKEGDTVFVYYAGHGATEPDLASQETDGYSKFLVTYDARTADLFASAVNMRELDGALSRVKAATLVVALDTCYSGAGGRGFSRLGGGRDVRIEAKFLERVARAKGRAVLTAAGPNEIAVEVPSLGHGLFTFHMLQGLRGAADRDKKGFVTLADVYRYVYERVSRQARELGGNQAPMLIAEAAGDIVLGGDAARVTSVGPRRPEKLQENERELEEAERALEAERKRLAALKRERQLEEEQRQSETRVRVIFKRTHPLLSFGGPPRLEVYVNSDEVKSTETGIGFDKAVPPGMHRFVVVKHYPGWVGWKPHSDEFAFKVDAGQVAEILVEETGLLLGGDGTIYINGRKVGGYGW